MEERTLDNVAAELEGLEGLIVTVSTLVAPSDYNISAGMPSQRMIDLAFYSIGKSLKRIREDVEAIAMQAGRATQKRTAL